MKPTNPPAPASVLAVGRAYSAALLDQSLTVKAAARRAMTDATDEAEEWLNAAAAAATLDRSRFRPVFVTSPHFAAAAPSCTLSFPAEPPRYLIAAEIARALTFAPASSTLAA